jgi:PleD family two-component response regulator
MPATPSARPRTRVLVVDDNRDAADTLVLLLKVSGYDAKAEYDGKAAWKPPDGSVPTAFFPTSACRDLTATRSRRNYVRTIHSSGPH